MKITYEMNKAELTKAMKHHFHYKGKPWLILWIIVASFMLYFGISLMFSSSDKGLGLICCLLASVFFFRRQIAIWRSVRRTFHGKPETQTITIAVMESKLTLETDSSRSAAGWDNFIDLLVTKDGLLLYSQKNIFNWIPRSQVIGGTWEDLRLQ